MKDLFEFAGFQLSYFPTLNGALKEASPGSEEQGAVVLATLLLLPLVAQML